MNAFHVVDAVGGVRIRDRFSRAELISVINRPVGRDHLEVEIIDESGACARKAGDIGVRQGDFQRFIRAADDDALLEDLSIGQRRGLVGEIECQRRIDKCGEVDSPPAFIHVRNGVGAEGVIHIRRGIDERGFDEGRRGSRVGVMLPVKLDENRRRPGRMRTGLARSALVLIQGIDGRPGVLVGGGRGLKGRNPRARGDDVRLDASILAWAAARKIRHRIGAVIINKQIKPIIFRSTGGDDVLGDGGAADRL